ncbi:MAG TPA: carboxypeptidase regulatory-like domain-containing protein, partial [Solibacterales bacterium]|nr:carboxypeptidase regulatory-like domain-containing protein [Bryobacterales bacterium]
GEAYIYARHNSLNANDWQNNQAGQAKPATSYFYPGGSLSGPIMLPFTNFNRGRDKLFFFVGYELYKQTIDNGFYRAFVPTADMKAGNFSQSYLDSYRGSSYIGYAIQGAPNFPGGMVPQSAIDPRGLALMNLYPAPNVDPKTNNGFNYISTGTKQQDSYQLHPRVDWSISENTKLYVSYNRQRDTSHYTDTLWWRPDPTVPYPTPLDALNESDSVSVNLTPVFSPTLTNEFVGTYTYLNLPNSFHDPSKVDPAALGINYQTVFKSGIKQLPSLTGWGDGVANIIQPSGFQLTGSLYAKKTLPTLADNLSKVLGTHILKAGFYWEATNNNQPSSNNANGELSYANWGGNSTGNAYADMLTGHIAQYTESNKDVFNKMQYKSVAFYVQDSWKATRRLTLDFGMRFDHLGPWNDLDNLGLAVFDPSKYSNNPADVNKLTGVSWHAIDHSVPVSGSQGRLMFYSPRGGFAYDIFGSGKTVLRGGYGVYRFHDEQNVQASALNIGHGSYSYTTPGATTFDQIAAIQATFVAPGGINVVQRNDSQQPRTQSYSFTVSQKTLFSSLFEISYVGNKSDYLSNWNNNFGQLNLVPYGSLFNSITATNLAPDPTPFRKYQNYQTIKEIQHVMYSNYNSLQASWNKQSGRVNYLLNYTFSKALGIRGEGGSPSGDPTNLNNDYGVLPNDRTHIFNVAYVINLPDPAHTNMLAKAVANGWQISGISQFQSGANLQGVASSNFNLGGTLPAGTTIPGTGVALNAGAGISPTLINGSPDINVQPILTCDPRKGLAAHQFVNPNCFALPTPGHNGAFIFPYLKGPAYFNNDLSAFKNFNFSETKKLQLRFSAYNFLNHPITSFISGDQNLSLNLDPVTGKSTNQRFGYADYKIGHRIIQLALKFYF